MFKVMLYFLGILFTSVGIFFTLIYCNLFTMGYSFFEYVNFIIRRIEFWFIFLGLFLICFSLERLIKNELFLRHHSKLGRK